MNVLRLPLRVFELVLVGIVALGCACVLVLRQLRWRSISEGLRRLLVLNTMYTLGVLRARKAEHMITWRDLDGYFEHVWSVHPLVGAAPGGAPGAGVGPPAFTPLNTVHTMVEGKTGRYGALARFQYLNFALAQAQLVLALDRIVGRESVSIVRGDPYYCGMLALLLGRLNGQPVEVRINGNHDAIYETTGELAHGRLFRWRWVEQRVARFVLSRADSVVVGSEDNAQFALANGARPERLAYTGNLTMINPVHLEEPGDREPLGDEFGLGDRPVVVCVTRLERVKHPEDVVVSVAKARRCNPRIAGVIVGDGTMKAELQQLCAQLGLEDHLIFTGDRDQPWIARLLPRCTVVAAPLAGLALVESALSGTPIVAYDVEWHAEVLQTNQTGTLVPYRDTDAMAEAICALVEYPERAGRLGAAAREHVLETMGPAKLLAHERGLADQLLPALAASGPARAGLVGRT